jgi:hypothetical protein
VISDCDNLDGYLADELSAEGKFQFAQHVDECDECRQAIEEQRWIDGLLRASASESRELTPASLFESLRTMPARRRPTVRLIACGLAAIAAAIAIAAGWNITWSPNGDEIAVVNDDAALERKVQDKPDIQSAIAVDPHRPQATFVSSEDLIVVPLESGDEEVSVVQLYPTTQTERRWRRELALQITHSESNGG